MFASVVTGRYCSVHRLLFVNSLQAWLPCGPAQIERTCGDGIQVIEATCPQCLTTAKMALQTQFPSLYRLP